MVREKIKIAQVVSTFPPYRGGMGNVAFHLADSLSQKSLNLTVFTPKTCSQDHNIQSYFEIYKLKPQFKYGNSALVFQLAYLLFKYGIVHLHYPFMGASIPTLIAKLLRGKKLKLVVHYHMDLVGRDWKSYVYRIYNFIFLPVLVKFADRIIATSDDYLKSSLIYKYYQKYRSKFSILPNGVNLDYFTPKEKQHSLVDKYDLAGQKVILFVGALDSSHYFKGVNYLIKAFEILNKDDVKLIIVGSGDLLKIYQEMADSFDLSKKIIFTGYIPDNELVDYYNLCDIFVLPSIDKSEAFGMVLLEAMACAKPVIATDLAGVRQVVEKKVNGLLVKPKNATHLAEQINFLLNHPDVARQYGQAGRQKVVGSYGWQTIADKLLEIYEI